MSGIELAPLVGMVIPITVAFFSCADESQLRHVYDDESDFDNGATTLRVPRRPTTAISDTPGRISAISAMEHRRRSSNGLDVAIFRLDGSHEERREGTGDFLVTSQPTTHR